MSQFSIIPKTTQLLARYETLALKEQELLQFISIFFEAAAPATITGCFREFTGGISDPDSSRGEERDQAAALRKLQEMELVTLHCRCNPLIVEIISRKALVSGNFSRMAGIIRENLPDSGQAYDELPQKELRHLREMRIGLYLGDFEHFNNHLLRYYECMKTAEQSSPLVEIINNPFEARWFRTLPPSATPRPP